MDSVVPARVLQRILAGAEPTPGGCLLVGHPVPQPNGYVVVGWRADGVRARAYAHRAVYAAEHGPLAPGVVVAHRCDTRHCVAIAHLVAATQAENLADMVAKGRSNRGERHWNWKGGSSRNYREGRNRAAGALL